MSDPQAPPLNVGAILKALLDHRVEFVVVGGIASTGHGSTRFTKDLDICPDWNDANLAKVTAALRALGAQMKTDHARGMGTQPSVRMLRKMEITTWRTPAGDIDVLQSHTPPSDPSPLPPLPSYETQATGDRPPTDPLKGGCER